MNAPLSHRVHLRSDVRFRRMADEGVVVRQEDGEVIVVNELGVRILELIDAPGREPATAEEISAELEGEYSVAPERLLSDVRRFLVELEEAGVLQTSAGDREGVDDVE